jgi:FlaA1/EpsC-like NDP-sugar epimerase
MARGGEVFVLDMGEPLRMIDVARQMIERAGAVPREVADAEAELAEGEIGLHVTGLRAGEKLHEELLIGGARQGTAHPKIFCVHEGFPSAAQIALMLRDLRAALTAADDGAATTLLSTWIEGYGAPQPAAPAPAADAADADAPPVAPEDLAPARPAGRRAPAFDPARALGTT